MLGFSLTFTWSFFVFYGSFWNEGARYVGNASLLFSFACCIGNIVGFALTSALNWRRNRFGASDTVNIAVSVVSFVGMALAMLSFLVPLGAQGALLMTGGFLEGLATAWITAMWGVYFVSLCLAQRTLCLLGSVVVGAVFYLVLLVFPDWLQPGIVCLLIPLSWMLANACNKDKALVQKESADSYARLKSETKHVVFAMALFGVFFWLCRTLKVPENGPSFLGTVTFVGIYSLLMVVVAVALVVLKKQICAEVIFRFALPASTLGVIIIFCLSDRFVDLGFSLFMSAYALMDVFLFLVLCNASRRTRCNPVKGICFGRFFQAISMPLGMALGVIASRFDFAIEESTVALGVIFLLVVSMSTISSQNAPQNGTLSVANGDEENVSYVSSALEFARKCRIAVDRYGLSPREAEVMLLVTRGRSVPYVSEHLYMARGTTKAHVTSIYHKMGVKDRQEMIDLIESIPVE